MADTATLKVGDRVRIERDEKLYPSKGTWPQFRGMVGTIVEINLGERGVVFGKVWPRRDRPGVLRWGGVITWFLPRELRVVAREPEPVSERFSGVGNGQVPDAVPAALESRLTCA